MIGGSLGPITVGIDCGGAFNVGKMLQAAEHWPINFGFLGRGNTSRPRSILDQMRGGVHRPEDSRGLGLDAGGDRHLPVRSPTSSTSRCSSTPTR